MPTVFNQSLWGDEGFSAILSMKSLPDIVKTIINDTSPPLWNIFEHLAFRVFGTGEVVVRSLSFFFFLCAVFFTYKIGAYLFDKKAGFLAAVLTFLNPFFFIYAFEGRMYSILAAGVAASMYFFISKKWFPYVIATLFALYSHHFSIFALLVQGIWFLHEFAFGDKKTAKSMFKSFIAVGILYLPWIYPLYLQTGKVGGGFWLATPNLTDLRNLIYDYLAEGIKSHPFRVFSYPIHQIALWTTLIILVLRKWGGKIKETIFLSSWFLIPIFAAWTVSQFFQSIFFNRYLLYTIPAAMLLLASQKRGSFSKITVGIVIALFCVIDFYYFTHPAKIPFRDLATYVKGTQTSRDFLINEDPGNHKLWESKYYNIPAPIYSPNSGDLPFFVGTALMDKDDMIQSLPKNTGRLGVITYKRANELNIKGFTIVDAEKRFGDLNFVWLKAK